MSTNEKPPKSVYVNDEVRGGHNPTKYEQRPTPPAKPPEKPKK